MRKSQISRLKTAAAVLAINAASACTHAHAKGMPGSSALEMPAPPAHDVEPIEPDWRRKFQAMPKAEQLALVRKAVREVLDRSRLDLPAKDQANG